MMVNILVPLIQTIAWILVIAVIVDVILSYFMRPYDPVRVKLDHIVNIFLDPIRKLLPSNLGLDISPIIFIFIVQILETILISLVTSIG